jgi:hypothetical protein
MTWVHYFTPESERSCLYGISSTQKIQDATVSQMFWDSEGVIRVDFLPHNVTVSAHYRSNLLHNDMRQVIWKKIHRKLSKNTHLLMAD